VASLKYGGCEASPPLEVMGVESLLEEGTLVPRRRVASGSEEGPRDWDLTAA